MATPAPETHDRTGPVLDLLQGWFEEEAGGPAPLPKKLRDLAGVLRASAVGLAVGTGAGPAVLHHVGTEPLPPLAGPYPWEEQPDLLARARLVPTSLSVPRPDGSCWLLAMGCLPLGGEVLLWAEGAPEKPWSFAAGAALALAAQGLGRCPATEGVLGAALERGRLQQQLEQIAPVIGRLAHDFGNLFTGILGFTELSRMQVPRDSLPHRYLQEVWQSAQQGAQWVGRLRLFSRRRAPEYWPVSLAALVVEQEARVRPAWGPAVALKVDLQAGLPPVALDAESVQHLLTELLENAREAVGDAGSVTLQARVCRLGPAECEALLGRTTAGPHVELTVADSGPGLDADAQGRLFRELGSSSKPRHRGLGLGVVYGIVQAYGGGVRFESTPGKGTTVRVFLPVAAVPEPEQAPAPAAAPGTDGPRLMVVDDDPLVLQLICSILTSAGYQAQGAHGPAEALDLYAAAAEPFALVLSDVVMPCMSGFDLVRRLQERDLAVNALFISSQSWGRDGGADDPGLSHFPFLEKPFRREALLRAVRGALERGRRLPPSLPQPT